MLVFVENIPCESQIPEIGETAEEKGLSLSALKKKYTTLARSRFIRAPPIAAVNRVTNWPIELSNRVINEWWAKSRTRERIIAIQLLDVMIEGAAYLGTVKDDKNTPGIDTVSYFENYCTINSRPFKINITVKKTLNSNRRFAYYYSARSLDPQSTTPP
jgi:hypothetical protein